MNLSETCQLQTFHMSSSPPRRQKQQLLNVPSRPSSSRQLPAYGNTWTAGIVPSIDDLLGASNAGTRRTSHDLDMLPVKRRVSAAVVFQSLASLSGIRRGSDNAEATEDLPMNRLGDTPALSRPTLTLRRAPTQQRIATIITPRHTAHAILMFVLVIAAGLGIFFVALEVILQTSAALQSVPVNDTQPWVTKFAIGPKTFVVGGSYILLIVVSIMLTLNRAVTVRSAAMDIPKLHIPFRKDDLPYSVFKTVQRGIARAKAIDLEPVASEVHNEGWLYNRSDLTPLLESPTSPMQTGSGRRAGATRGKMVRPKLKVTRNKKKSSASLGILPRTSAPPIPSDAALVSPVSSIPMSVMVASGEKKPVHLKRAVINACAVLRSKLRKSYFDRRTAVMSPSSAGDISDSDAVQDERYRLLLERPHTMTMVDYINALASAFDIDQAPVTYFCDIYTMARFSDDEITESEYQTSMKCLVAIAKRINEQCISDPKLPSPSARQDAILEE